jgi:PPOX class probable F420-dependent enzyme
MATDIDTSSARGAHADERLRHEIIAWLTTVRPSGQPDTVPVWFLWDAGSVLIYSRPDKAKQRNIEQNPRVSLVLDNTHGGGDVVRIEGTAEVAPDYPLAADVPAYVSKYSAPIERIGYDPRGFAEAYPVAIRVTPTKIHY